MRHLRRSIHAIGALAAAALVMAPPASSLSLSQDAFATNVWQSGGSAWTQSRFSCGGPRDLCTEVANPQDIWGRHYVGHDEPAVLFYSGKPGSGNRMTYQIQLPREPRGKYSNRKSYDFELGPAFWFGLALCDTYSYPQTVGTCTPDSDSNAVNVAKSRKHPGSAYMELQFYPPGWVPQFAAQACDPTRWCAALTTDSLSENPITGTVLNPSCQGRILGGPEYGNFAYLTHNGEPQAAPNPLEFDPEAAGQPGSHVLYMKPGDKLTLSMHDSRDGLVTKIVDHTTGQSGFMTASAGNEFGHMVPAPTGTRCHVQYYDFHPMYSTSRPSTTVPWAAATYNVAFVQEIGHFQLCTHIDANSPLAQCDGLEGPPGHRSPADADDFFCFGAEESLLYPAIGCTNADDPGFDGPAYLKDYPDGKANHPTPWLVSSPRTGGKPYSRAGFNADLPAIESPPTGPCDVVTGRHCTNPPVTDQGKKAFYPYWSTVSTGGGCRWALGRLAGRSGTTSSFGGNSKTEYGHLERSRSYVFNGGGATQAVYLNYQRILPNNPC
jgi:hypothetical protein